MTHGQFCLFCGPRAAYLRLDRMAGPRRRKRDEGQPKVALCSRDVAVRRSRNRGFLRHSSAHQLEQNADDDDDHGDEPESVHGCAPSSCDDDAGRALGDDVTRGGRSELPRRLHVKHAPLAAVYATQPARVRDGQPVSAKPLGHLGACGGGCCCCQRRGAGSPGSLTSRAAARSPRLAGNLARPWPDEAVAAAHAPRHALVGVRVVKRLQHRRAHLHNLVNRSAA